MNIEAEESPRLEADARKRLINTLQAGENLMFATVWRLAVALRLLVAASCVYKGSVRRVTKQKSVHTHTRICDSV
jgi:hypothetical protein